MSFSALRRSSSFEPEEVRISSGSLLAMGGIGSFGAETRPYFLLFLFYSRSICTTSDSMSSSGLAVSGAAPVKRDDRKADADDWFALLITVAVLREKSSRDRELREL